jgi:hypothetical protein
MNVATVLSNIKKVPTKRYTIYCQKGVHKNSTRGSLLQTYPQFCTNNRHYCLTMFLIEKQLRYIMYCITF